MRLITTMNLCPCGVRMSLHDNTIRVVGALDGIRQSRRVTEAARAIAEGRIELGQDERRA